MSYTGNNLTNFVLHGLNCEFDELINKYAISYFITDLNKLETFKLFEFVGEKESVFKLIDGNLYKILRENNTPTHIVTYNHLIEHENKTPIQEDILNSESEVNFIEKQFLFDGIKLKDEISTLDDIIIIPDTEKHILRVLNEIRLDLMKLD